MSVKGAILLFMSMLLVQITAQEKQEASYSIFGYVRGWHETDLANNSSEFKVVMSRLGIKGKLSEKLSYGLFVDFSRLGKLSTTSEDVNGNEVVTNVSASFSDYLLDAYAAIKPISGLSVQLGQFKVPFSTENLTSASAIPFVNRSLVRTYTSPGLRDIGGMVTFENKTSLPVTINFGLFNGSGQNKTEDDYTTNYAARIVAAPVTDVKVSANYYGGTAKGIETSYWNIGAEYVNSGLSAAAEFGGKKSNLPTTDKTAFSYFLYALYDFHIESDLVPIIQPGLRFDSADPDNNIDNNEVKRITVGLAFILTQKKQTHIRVNYEKYDMADGSTAPDKLILEFQLRF